MPGLPRMHRRDFLTATGGALLLPAAARLSAAAAAASTAGKHFLYVATPGIRNYLEYGGIGVLVFDIAKGYQFVKRIPTWTIPAGQEAENVKGIAASAR